jgi:hypothetical protein
MIDVNLDPEGRLVFFAANPVRVDENADQPPPPADWSAVFAAAGLDATRFTPAKPRLNLPHIFGTRVAWTGTFPHAPEIPMRIEAAFAFLRNGNRVYGLGNHPEAFIWLEKAYRDRDGYLWLWLNLDQRFDSLRSDPRFSALLDGMQLAQ